MKNAGIKSREEAKQRLDNGEVFYCYGKKIYFDVERVWDGESPYMFGKQEIQDIWNQTENWKVETDWRDEASPENPVLCWVWDEISSKRPALVTEYIENELYPYRSLSNWKYAEPVKTSDCWSEE